MGKKKTSKTVKKDSALIEGKIDSKLINDFDGEFEVLNEKEKTVAKEAVEKLRKEEKRNENIANAQKNIVDVLDKLSAAEKQTLCRMFGRQHAFMSRKQYKYVNENTIRSFDKNDLKNFLNVVDFYNIEF